MLNYRIVFNIIGILLMMLSGFMLLTIPVSIIYQAGDFQAILISSLITLSGGLIFWLPNRKFRNKIGKREGYLVVALGWIFVSLFSCVPYLLGGVFPSFVSALFESVSGLTTTGATGLADIEIVSKGILFWRSLTQWLGGMGIIVLTVAIFPLLGIGGVELFVNEAPGPSSDKIHPRISETAKRLWIIYLGLSFTLILILKLLGMDFYDALNHGLTTMATGGFSTHNESIAFFNVPSIQYTICVFMLVAGVNYTLIYYAFKFKFKRVWKSDEFKTYIFLMFLFIAFLSCAVFYLTDLPAEEAFRNSAFQIISVITTTGFVTADYTSWSPMITTFFFGLLFIGACAGSTSGGIKIIRHLVLFKNSFLELKRVLHPKAIIRVKVDGNLVAPRILTHILVFFLFYLMLFVVGTMLMCIILSDFQHPILSAAGAVATCLGNVGPAIGEFGPMNNFVEVPLIGKWVLIILMLLGRLELFTILVLFSPYFWRSN